jgi:hypothetical protein
LRIRNRFYTVSSFATIHFEKGNYNFRGAAQFINWEMAKALKTNARGIYQQTKILRSSWIKKRKISYGPEFIYPAYF